MIASAALTKDPYQEAKAKGNTEQETGIVGPPVDTNTSRSVPKSLRPPTPPTRNSFTHDQSPTTPTRRPITYTQILRDQPLAEGSMAAHSSAVQRAQSALDQALKNLDQASRQEVISLRNQIESLEQGVRLKDEESNAEIERLHRENFGYKSQLDYLRSHNDKLREDIVEMGNDLNPDYGEDYYTSGFEQLAAKIERWIATHPVSSSVEASKDFVKSVWETLGTTSGVTWKITNGPLVNPKVFRLWYQDPSTRLQLLRYFVSAFLFQEVFQPFVYGMEPPGSATIRMVSEEILSNG
jgi:polyhydroxyalkanoate synthesis regulator phasin